MPSQSRYACLTPIADARKHQRRQREWLEEYQSAPCQGHEQAGHGRQPKKNDWTDRHRSVQGLALQLLLGLGLSLVGSSVLAEPVSPTSPPSAPSSAVELPRPKPLSQSAPETPVAQQASHPQAPETQDLRLAGDPIEDAITQGGSIQGDSEARHPSVSKGNIYAPIRLQSGSSVEDTLTTKDIPMGQGSFARDYVVTLKANDQVAIDLFSDSFDTVVTLMSENGTTLGENDDGPDGGTNSLLFMRITEDGEYVVRVRGFGQAKGGPFKLKLTRLKAAQ